MVSATPGLLLALSIADCCAVLIWDPVRSAVGAVHAGWRGARDRIVARALSQLQASYGSQTRDLRVYLSPCASGARYEVGPEVAQSFPHSVRAERGRTLRYYLDLSAELRRQLLELEVPAGSVEASPICTMADSRCHSHRRDGSRAGRMAAFVGLRPPA